MRIVEVGGRASLRAFVGVPNRIYCDQDFWIPPLRIERLSHYSKSNPFTSHADWKAWIAYPPGGSNGPVGRITAQIDQLYLERHGKAVGYFGSLDCIDDDSAFAALTSTAEHWLLDNGMERICGPFNLGINQEIGQLVSGFEAPVRFMTPFGPSYAPAHLERLGYGKAVDLFAYRVRPDFESPRAMTRILNRLGSRIRVRTLRRRSLRDDLEVMRDIFNDAWYENWGFVPFTSEEFQRIGRELTLLLPDDYIQIAELDGQPVSFGVMLPDINEAIADLGGRLFPFGFVKLLWRLKVKHPSAVRVPLMGVRRRFHNTRLGLALAFAVCDPLRWAGHAHGATEMEMSWILENNRGMRGLAEAFGGEAHKRYRMYEKELSA